MSSIFCWKCGKAAHLKVELFELDNNGEVEKKITLMHNDDSDCDNRSANVTENAV
jgi:hypothetical protein